MAVKEGKETFLNACVHFCHQTTINFLICAQILHIHSLPLERKLLSCPLRAYFLWMLRALEFVIPHTHTHTQ